MVFVKSKSKELLECFINNILRMHLIKTKKEANKKFFFIGFSQKIENIYWSNFIFPRSS